MELSKELEQEYLKRVRVDGIYLKEIDHQTPAICLEAVRENRLALQFVHEQTLEICMVALEQNPEAIKCFKI